MKQSIRELKGYRNLGQKVELYEYLRRWEFFLLVTVHYCYIVVNIHELCCGLNAVAFIF